MKLSVALRDGLSIPALVKKAATLDGSATPGELVEITANYPAIAMQQISSEFLQLADLVKSQACERFLEIGTYRGGTLFVFSQLSRTNATIISVDYPTTRFGRALRAGQNAFLPKLVRRGQSLALLREDSHSFKTLARVREILRGETLDFLFIDGDHSYSGVRSDFEMYAPLVRSGGLIAFHDVAKADSQEEVHRLWNEIKPNYRHAEFVHRTGRGAMGIGVLWV
ncbi:MAG TPA: class I SAM-dependent methyltransferase [Terracidiphilus sp.]|nr:class I SAM-dependent methyltransferase [Terracidiphilus sp.]